LKPSGPDNVDVECRASLQKLLRPRHYPAIDGWMRTHSTKDKMGVVKLAEAAVGDNGVPVKQDLAYNALMQPVQHNPKGRHRVSDAVHVTADRLQADLQKLRSGSDQQDLSLVAKRKFVRDFASVPNIDSVSEFYRLSDVPVAAEPAAKVLNEDARRGLTRWQTRAPEQSREATAQAMQSLRSINDAVEALPTYNDQLREKGHSGMAHERIHDYSLIRDAARSGLYARQPLMTTPGRGLSRSCPTIPPAYLSADELASVKRPGGFRVDLTDCEPLQMRKNRQRNIVSKIVQGGQTNWTSTYGAMAADLK